MKAINILYATDADAGLFYSSAKLNCDTGDVFDIELNNEEDAESIEQIFRVSVIFKYKDNEYQYDVDPQEDYVYNYKDTEFYRLIQSEKMAKELNETLANKANKERYIKV